MDESRQFAAYQETLRAKNVNACNALLSRLAKFHGDAFVKIEPVVVIEAPIEPIIPEPAPIPVPSLAISDIVSGIEEGPRRPTIQEIKKTVCKHFNITLADIESPRRNAAVVRPRQIVYYLCRRLTSRSLPEIARRLGNRDHTTALAGIKRVAALMEQDSKIANDVALLEAQFK